MSTAASGALQLYFIQDLITGDRFYFHAMFEIGSGYSVSKSVNWIPTSIIGRSSPILGYSNSEGASFSLSVPIFASIEQGDGRTVQDVREACDFFLSLAYPDYTGGDVKPPHRCRLYMAGQLKVQEVVCTNVDVNYLGPWDVDSGLSHRASVTISFQEVDDVPKDYSDVR